MCALVTGVQTCALPISAHPIVMCNFGVLTTGFDAPSTSAAVIARPTRSLVLYSQMVGRAPRGVKAKGNATAELVTVVDPHLPGFGDVAEASEHWIGRAWSGEGVCKEVLISGVGD